MASNPDTKLLRKKWEQNRIKCSVYYIYTIYTQSGSLMVPRAYFSIILLLLNDSLSVNIEDLLQIMMVLGPDDIKRSKDKVAALKDSDYWSTNK